MSKTPKQEVMILTEQGEIVFAKLPADTLYVASHDDLKAWELDSNQQAITEKNNRLQVVSERSKKPIRVFRNRPVLNGKSTDVIANQKEDEELTVMERKSQKSSVLLWVGIICAIIAVTIGIIVLSNMWRERQLLTILPFTAFTGILKIRRKGHNEQPKSTMDEHIKRLKTKGTGLVKCFVFVEENRRSPECRLERSFIPDDSLERKYKGKPAHVLGLDGSGFWAIEPDNALGENDSPLDLYMALECEQEVAEVYGMEQSLIEKIKLGLLFALGFALVITLFLISTIVMGD